MREVLGSLAKERVSSISPRLLCWSEIGDEHFPEGRAVGKVRTSCRKARLKPIQAAVIAAGIAHGRK